jgi:quercetin dioxygenase-like cupin family protein
LQLRPDVDGARYFALSLQRTTLSYYEVDAGARFPRHAHDVEQLTLVIDGRLDFEFDDRKVSIGPGEAVAIPPGVMHAVRGGEAATRAVDAWGPARPDM